jgi:hypothetical protein
MVAVDSSNQDTVQDLTLFLYGQVGDTANPIDTARAFTIFGQNSLDSVGVINLELMGTIQYTPYFAVELLPNQYLVDREPRDPSGDESYRLLPINQPIPKPVEKSPPAMQNAWSVRLYPNPAVYSTNLEIMSVPPGEYHVEIVASSGIIEHRQELTVGGSGELLRALDLQALPSGYYVVRVFSSERLYGAYPILVTK